jgi:hypothetical protein
MDDPVMAVATAFVLSLMAAVAAVAGLVDYFWYGEDLDLLVWPVAVFVVVALAVFATTSARARDTRTLAIVAAGLAVAALALAFGLVGVIARLSTNPPLLLGTHDRLIATGLAIPMLLAVMIQWRIVRRAWLSARGRDHATAWPWVTTFVACAVVLNPLGMQIFGAAINPSVTDWFAGLWRMVALIATGMLVVIGLIEWRIRLRKRNTARVAAPG